MRNSRNNEAFTKGLIWNYISLIFMGMGGFCFSLLIGFFYDVETLGYFNTFYALYIAFSQLAVFGCQNAVTKYVSESPENKSKAKSILVMSLIVIGAVNIILNIIIRMLCSICLKDRYSILEINALLFGILLFAINKAILGYLNGLSKMSEYGILQSLRYIFIAGLIVCFAKINMSREWLLTSFLGSELLILIVEIPIILREKTNKVCVEWSKIKDLFWFGYEILPANLVLELNSKADVLCLSFVTGDERLVGIYSFSVLFAEGFYQLFVVIRRSINPKITLNYLNDKLESFYDKTNVLICRFGYIGSILCGIIVVIVYRFACLFMKDSTYHEGTLSLIVIIIAIVINERGIVWGNLLSQIGKPKFESRINAITVLSNIVMNILLIYTLGMFGAALATTVSYFVFSIVQKKYIEKELGF